MANVGIKASRIGYDILSAADYELIINSNNPLLELVSYGSFTITDATADQVIYTHNLGYVPAFLVFETSAYIYGSSGESKLSTSGTSQYFGMNATHLKWLGATRGAFAGTVTGNYAIFTWKLQTTYTSTILNSVASSQNVIDNIGYKISSNGNDCFSSDFKDFTVHSATRTPLIHKTGYGSYTYGTTFSATHNLGYQPLYFWYGYLPIYDDNYWQQIFTTDEGQATSTTTELSAIFVFDHDYAYIILKDPLTIN